VIPSNIQLPLADNPEAARSVNTSGPLRTNPHRGPRIPNGMVLAERGELNAIVSDHSTTRVVRLGIGSSHFGQRPRTSQSG
jgi:hypothetical protein